ncbi:hypothetical protein EWM64_g9413 [Hericium alpestre]|uniref:Ferritin/DPS protein domain-containing protein n=1 Tax=Hericium alpestre TaxID=135208 RepID=A0A4Y9ZME7_9AGAM|nr:hypothetical protein EWM64_g9413 [Hericium alpestre]
MQFKVALASLAILATQVSAIPYRRWGADAYVDHPNITDTDILNFALTLENLENAFYWSGLQNFTQADFDAAGLAAPARGFYEQVALHEKFHIDNLTTILGDKAVQPCTYNFPVNGNISNFISLSDMFEVIGTSAYNGAAKFIKDPNVLQTAASILATEARQSAWINNAVRGGNPWSTAYETALDLDQAFSLAAGLIVECPSNNTAIPVQAFPPVTASPADAAPGSNLTLEFTLPSGANNTQLFATFLTGISPISVPLYDESPFTVTIPPTLEGFVFLVVTNSTQKTDDTVTVAGPLFLNFPFNSNNSLVTLAH